MQEILLAVYGTLKQGNDNYETYLAPKKPKFKGYFDVKFRMFSNGKYPMLIPSDTSHKIYLEVYYIDQDQFDRINHLEEPFGYHVRSIETEGVDKPMMIYAVDQKNPPDGFETVDSGNFQATVKW